MNRQTSMVAFKPMISNRTFNERCDDVSAEPNSEPRNELSAEPTTDLSTEPSADVR